MGLRPRATQGRGLRTAVTLWHLRDQAIHDPIGYRAFKRKKDALLHARKFFPDTNRTGDIPAYQAAYLINGSLKLILSPVVENLIDLVRSGTDAEGHLLDAPLLRRCNEQLANDGMPRMGTHYRKRDKSCAELTSLHHLLFRIIPLASRIVIAAFSARRNKEINALPLDCVGREANGDFYLNTLISKNLRRFDKIPVPASVSRAVEVVKLIRGSGGRDSHRLFQLRCPILKSNICLSGRGALDLVRDFVGVPALDDGTHWHFTPHQFRKFFGVTYFWRWSFPNLTALTLHYRHFNMQTTRGYVEMKAAEELRMADEKAAKFRRKLDRQRLEDFESSNRSFVEWVLRSSINGEDLKGTLGDRINAKLISLRDEYLNEIQVTAAQDTLSDFDKALSALAAQVSLQVHPEGHSLCGFGTVIDGIDLREGAQCLQLKQRLCEKTRNPSSGPDFAFSEDEGCLVCPLRASLPSMSLRWEQEIDSAEEALRSAPNDLKPVLSLRLSVLREHN